MNEEQILQEPQGNGVLPCVSGSYFSNKFRIITDEYNGYEVQIKRWWFPFWVQCWKNGSVNSFTSIDKAKDWILNGRPDKSKVVEYL